MAFEIQGINIPGVDVEKGLDLFDGDEVLYASTLRSYLFHTPAILDKLRHVSSGTLSLYAAYVHDVKGSSATICAEGLKDAAQKLEKTAKDGDLSGVLALNEKFLKSADELIANIRKWHRQYDAMGQRMDA